MTFPFLSSAVTSALVSQFFPPQSIRLPLCGIALQWGLAWGGGFGVYRNVIGDSQARLPISPGPLSSLVEITGRPEPHNAWTIGIWRNDSIIPPPPPTGRRCLYLKIPVISLCRTDPSRPAPVCVPQITKDPLFSLKNLCSHFPFAAYIFLVI